MQAEPSQLSRHCFGLEKRLAGAHILAIPSCIHYLLGSKAGTEIERSMSFSSSPQEAYSLVRGQVILTECNVCYNGGGTKALELGESKAYP